MHRIIYIFLWEKSQDHDNLRPLHKTRGPFEAKPIMWSSLYNAFKQVSFLPNLCGRPVLREVCVSFTMHLLFERVNVSWWKERKWSWESNKVYDFSRPLLCSPSNHSHFEGMYVPCLLQLAGCINGAINQFTLCAGVTCWLNISLLLLHSTKSVSLFWSVFQPGVISLLILALLTPKSFVDAQSFIRLTVYLSVFREFEKSEDWDFIVTQ